MQRIAVDFDGVLNNYNGWKGETELSTPRPFVEQFLEQLSKKYEVAILTSRNPTKVEEWLYENQLDGYITLVTSQKIPAIAYIDDRAIHFNGNYNNILKELETFTPHWQKKADLHKKTDKDALTHALDKLTETINTNPYQALRKIEQLQKTLSELRKIAIVEAYDTRHLIFEEEIGKEELKEE